jgi:hypothetical protein
VKKYVRFYKKAVQYYNVAKKDLGSYPWNESMAIKIFIDVMQNEQKGDILKKSYEKALSAYISLQKYYLNQYRIMFK